VPVYDQGYRPYGGERKGLRRRWIPLFREEALPYLRKKRFLLLLILAVVPWFYGIALTYLHTQLGDAEWAKDFLGQLPKVDETLVARLLTNGWSIFLMMIVSIWVGSGLVARDRKQRTLEVFLGRALGPVQYLWAKGAALGLFFLIFSMIPVTVLVIFHVGLSGDLAFLWTHGRVLWGTLLFSAVGLGSLTLFLLCISSLSKSPRVVGILLVGVAFFGWAASGILFAITRSEAAWFFGLIPQIEALGILCLGADVKSLISPLQSGLFFSLLTLGSLGVLWIRFGRKGVLR